MIDNRTEAAYCEALDSLRFSTAQKENMVGALLAAGTNRSGVRWMRPVKRGLTVALAAVLVLSLTVGAAATGVLRSASEFLAPLLGGTPAQTEIIDKIGRPVNASDTHDGVTVTADAIIGDETNMMVVFTISRDDGTALFPDGEVVPAWENNDMSIPADVALRHALFGPRGSSTHGGMGFVDYRPGAASVQYFYTSSGDIQDYSIACFDNLGYFQGDGFVTVAGGHWEIPLKIDFEEVSVSAAVEGESLAYEDCTLTLEKMKLSPIGFALSFRLTCPPTADYPELAAEKDGMEGGSIGLDPYADDSPEQREYMDLTMSLRNLPITLRLKDGREIDLSCAGCGFTFAHDADGKIVGGEGEKSDVFAEIVPIEDMECVIVNGIEYPVIP